MGKKTKQVENNKIKRTDKFRSSTRKEGKLL